MMEGRVLNSLQSMEPLLSMYECWGPSSDVSGIDLYEPRVTRFNIRGKLLLWTGEIYLPRNDCSRIY